MTISTLELEYVMALVWPEGIPRSEKALAYTLNDHRREITVRRITGLLAYEDGAGWRSASETASLNRPAFFALVSAWRKDRSLRTVTPRATEHRRIVRFRPEMERTIREVMQESPDLKRREIATVVRGRLLKPEGLSTIDRVIDRLRTQDESIRLGGRDGFGKHIVIDSSIMIMDGSQLDRSLASVVALVVDVATGIVIAAAASDDAAAAIRVACRRASSRLNSMEDVTRSDTMIEMHFPAIPSGLTEGKQDVNGVRIAITRKTGSPSSPSRLSALLDHNFGLMKIRPKFTMEDRDRPEDRMPILSIMDAIADGQAERVFNETVKDGLIPATSPRVIAETIGMLFGEGKRRWPRSTAT